MSAGWQVVIRWNAEEDSVVLRSLPPALATAPEPNAVTTVDPRVWALLDDEEDD